MINSNSDLNSQIFDPSLIEKQFKVLDETKELYEQTLSSDDKAFNAMNTYETGIGPNVGQKTAVSDIMSSTESQGFFDSSTGQFVKEALLENILLNSSKDALLRSRFSIKGSNDG